MGKDAGMARPGVLQGLPVSERLNPSATASSRQFDPTFEGVGWGHKRLLRPDPLVAKDETLLGKRTFTAAPATAEELLRSSLPTIDTHARSSTRETRFTKGFNRKRHHDTPEDIARKEEVARTAAARVESAQASRRGFLATKQSKGGCNVVTGGPPIVGDHVQYNPPKLVLKAKSTIDRELGTADKQRVQETKHLEMAEKRRERLRLDGLPAQRRKWTAKEQLACYDGYVVTEDMSSELGQQPYKYGRRPIPRAAPVNNVFLESSRT